MINALAVIGICIFGFLLLRQAVLWYWKVDRVVVLLEQQNALLSKMWDAQNPDLKSRCGACQGVIEPNALKCPHCGAEFGT